jgi:hypothetical protein
MSRDSRRTSLCGPWLVQVYPIAPIRAKKRGRGKRLTNPNRMCQVMRVQDTFQNGPRAWQTDLIELGAQEIDGATVESFE